MLLKGKFVVHPVNWLVNFQSALTLLVSMGLLGIVFHRKIMQSITKKYIKSKYKMVAAFDQEN